MYSGKDSVYAINKRKFRMGNRITEAVSIPDEHF